MGIAAASLILSTLTLGAILGSMVLTRIEFTYSLKEVAALNGLFKPSTWFYAIRQASSKRGQ